MTTNIVEFWEPHGRLISCSRHQMSLLNKHIIKYTHNLLVVVVVATAVGGSQGGGALLQVPGFGAVFGGTAHRQCEDAVGVTVAAAGVRVTAAIARGPNEDGAFTSTALYMVHDKITH